MSAAKELAERFIQELPTWPTGRLPRVRELAVQYGASTRTVQEALKLLKSDGVIESRPRAGMWRSGERPSRDPATPRSGVEDLSCRLERELREGVYPWEEPLPLIKELALEWNCHVQTVSKVLQVMVGLGLLERKGRSHVPMRPSVSRKSSAPILLCLGASAPDGHFRMDTDREVDFWRELGIQAAQSGLVLRRRGWKGERLNSDSGVVGVVASTWHLHEPMLLCRELARLRIPSCVWVEEHILDGPSLDSRIRFHDQGYSTGTGAKVARHLFELGHTRIAFLSAWHGSKWSRNRLRGIEQEAARWGAQVDVQTLDGESEWDRLIPAVTDPVLTKEFPSKVLERILEGPVPKVRDFVIQELGWNRIRRDMQPLFEAAREGGATAWIGANDVCALNALGWLREQGMDVPREVSVAGVDDCAEALRSDLTSFRFSSASMARSMIRQILSPSTLAPVLTRHEGMVVARGTTSRPGETSSPIFGEMDPEASALTCG